MSMQGQCKRIHQKSTWCPPCSGPKRKRAIKSTRRVQWHSSNISCLYSKWGGLVRKYPVFTLGAPLQGWPTLCSRRPTPPWATEEVGTRRAQISTKILLNIFLDICGRQYFVPKLGFAILILPQGEYRAVATEENQAFEMTVSWKNHQWFYYWLIIIGQSLLDENRREAVRRTIEWS